MGLYDTFIFEKPFTCPACGADIKTVQSKAFACLIDTYRVGDAITDCGIRIGVVEEDLYCDACRVSQQGKRPTVFLVVWHGIYAGAYATMPEAETRLASIDRATLLEWHERQQDEKEDWSRRFHNLRTAISEWREYTLAEDKEAFLKKPMATLYSDLRDLVGAPDPLGSILEKYGKNLHEEDEIDIFGG